MATPATNYCLYSEAFDTSVAPSTTGGWQQLAGATVTADATTDPFGATTTADQVNFPNVANGERIEQWSTISPANGETWTFSCWLKGSGTMDIYITTEAYSGGYTQTNITLSGTWTRYSATVTFAAPTGRLRVDINRNSGETATAATVWGAQAEFGSAATDYNVTTSAASAGYPFGQAVF